MPCPYKNNKNNRKIIEIINPDSKTRVKTVYPPLLDHINLLSQNTFAGWDLISIGNYDSMIISYGIKRPISGFPNTSTIIRLIGTMTSSGLPTNNFQLRSVVKMVKSH